MESPILSIVFSGCSESGNTHSGTSAGGAAGGRKGARGSCAIVSVELELDNWLAHELLSLGLLCLLELWEISPCLGPTAVRDLHLLCKHVLP